METDDTLVLWDVGGVLLRLAYSGFYERGGELTNKTPEEFKAWYIQSKLEERALTGAIRKQQYFQALREKIAPVKLTDQQLKDWISLFWGNQVDETVDLKKRIHEKGYSAGILSSMTDYALEILFDKHPGMFETWGGPKVYSFEHGIIKPDLKIYQKIPKSFKKVIFIEDKAVYLDPGIENLGWSGIHLTAFIDSAEAIRAVHSEVVKQRENFRQVSSVEGLENALRFLGVKL